MIPQLDKTYIEGARLTAFNPNTVDYILKQYEDLTLVIHKHIEENKEDKLNKLCELYNSYLLQLGNHVSPWVAGRSNHKSKPTTPIDLALKNITNYVEEITNELKEIDHQNNKDKYEKKEKDKKTNRLIGEIGYFQHINRKLFYKRLVELHNLDKNVFKKVCKELGSKIANNSKVAKLYKELNR